MCFISSTSCPSITDWLGLAAIPLSIYLAYLGIKANNKNQVTGFLLNRIDGWVIRFDELTDLLIDYYNSDQYEDRINIVISTKVSDLSKDLSSLVAFMPESSNNRLMNSWQLFKEKVTGDDFNATANFPNTDLVRQLPHMCFVTKNTIYKELKSLD